MPIRHKKCVRRHRPSFIKHVALPLRGFNRHHNLNSWKHLKDRAFYCNIVWSPKLFFNYIYFNFFIFKVVMYRLFALKKLKNILFRLHFQTFTHSLWIAPGGKYSKNETYPARFQSAVLKQTVFNNIFQDTGTTWKTGQNHLSRI